MWSAFEECQNDFEKAANILLDLEKICPNLLQIAYRPINVERRRSDLDKCKELYEHYIEVAKNKNIAGSSAIKYARFCNKINGDLDGAIKVLQLALEKDPASTRVALQMINVALQRTSVDEEEILSIMDKFMARENVELEQRVLFAQRKVFGSGLLEAQRALQVALNKVNEAKKKSENSPNKKSSGSNDAGAALNQAQATAAYNNSTNSSSASYSYGSGTNSSYYGQSGQQQAYPQQQQQQQQQYDGYYNHW